MTPFAVPILLISGYFVTQQEIEETSLFGDSAFLASIPVESYPESLLPGGSAVLALIPVRSADETELLAAAEVPDGWLVLDTLVSSGEFNYAKSWAWWDPETQELALASQMPFRSLTFITVWQHEGEAFRLVREYREDPSEDALEDTRALLDSGLVEEAASRLFDIFYPSWYFDGGEMAARFLYASWHEARRRADSEDWQGALDAYFCAGPAYEQCALDPEWFLDAAGLGAEGSPVQGWMSVDVLLEILEHVATVADHAGDSETASRARNAFRALSEQAGSR